MANFAPVKQANDFERCPEGTFQFVISNFYNICMRGLDGNLVTWIAPWYMK
jgi:hypothetical protein